MNRSIILLATVMALFAADPGDPAVARGRKAFVSACGFCHGNDATGNRAPDLIRSALVNHDDHGELLGPIVRNGRPDKGMPGSPMTDTQIADIGAFLKARLKESLASASVPKDYPVEKLLTGNAKAGQAYFNGAGKCGSCHSPAGDLAGVAKKYTPVELQTRFLYPRGGQSTATVTLPSGKQISGKLEFLDEFDVAVRDAAGEYHSWPRSGLKVEVRDPLEVHRELMHHYTDDDVHNIFAYLETLK